MGTRMQYTPLTQEEREFAADNHYMVERYLRMKKLQFDEWYDVVVFRYLLSVKRWFADPELRKWKFSTIAYKAMWSAVGNERKSMDRRIKTISLDRVIDGTEGLRLIDTITEDNLNLIYIGGDAMNISYNVVLPERRSTEKSDEVQALETFLPSKMKNMCFEYDTAKEALSQKGKLMYYRKKNSHKDYEIFMQGNCIYVARVKKGGK